MYMLSLFVMDTLSLQTSLAPFVLFFCPYPASLPGVVCGFDGHSFMWDFGVGFSRVLSADCRLLMPTAAKKKALKRGLVSRGKVEGTVQGRKRKAPERTTATDQK